MMRGVVHSDHIVQFFDDPVSLAYTVADFLLAGYNHGDNLLVVAKAKNWQAIATRLRRRGCPVANAIERGRLTVLDAHATLAKLTESGRVDRAAFERIVAPLVRRLTAGPMGLSAYGEMVELLAEERNFTGALHLEELWNDLLEKVPFQLFCGYSAAHFVANGDREALARICHAHKHVTTSSADILGEWMAAQVLDEPSSPRHDEPDDQNDNPAWT